MSALTIPYSSTETRQQVRSLLNEPSPSYWTNDEIDKWIQEAAIDIATKTLCYEKTSDITLAATTLEYDGPTGDSGDDIIKIYAAVFYDSTNTYRGLRQIHPRMIQHLPEATAGEPYYWWYFNDKVGIFPLTSAGVVTATGKVKLYYSVAKGIEDVAGTWYMPYYYQLLTIYYAVAMARKKQRMNAEADQFYAMYLNSVNFHRADLYDRGVDSKDMFEIPDGSQVVGR